LITERIKKKNKVHLNKSAVFTGLFVFFLLFNIDYVSRSIFGISNTILKIEFKIFVGGWVVLGMSLGDLSTCKSMLNDERE